MSRGGAWSGFEGLAVGEPKSWRSTGTHGISRKIVAAVTFRPENHGAQSVATWAGRAVRALAGDQLVEAGGDEDTVVLCCNRGPEDVFSADGSIGILLNSATCRLASADNTGDGGTLLDGLGGHGLGVLASVAPPCGACLRLGGTGPTWLATDPSGLSQVYWIQAAGWAAASNSCALLARLNAAGFDEDALGAFSLLGHHMGDRTPFAGVRKVPAGMACRLGQGQIACVAYGERKDDEPPLRGPPLRGNVAARAGAAALGRSVGACIRSHPDMGLELSGGLDSRALLAAIPASVRRGMHAFTLGAPGSADVAVARDLARRSGLEHEVVDLRALGLLGSEEADALVRRASNARDHSANPLAAGVLEWVEGQLERRPHLTGQNGEYGRGFYYPGQRDHARVNDRLVERLARWRLFANERVDPRLLSGDFHEHARQWTLAELRQTFRQYRLPWLEATDEYYLRERMQRWAGPALSATANYRTVAAPYFHEPYLQWVRRTAPADRRGSRLFAEVLVCLDQELADIPLATGLKPRHIAGSTLLRARARRAGKFTRKVGGKMAQRLRGGERPATGAATLAAAVVEAWRRDEDRLAGVARLPFLDEDAVYGVATGRVAVNTASVAFLALLSAALDELRTST